MGQVSEPVLDDRYVLLETLGIGTSASVYKARDQMTNSFVAVKIFNVRNARKREAKEEFLNEVKVMQKLDHPNIVKINEFGENGKLVNGKVTSEIFFIVMEYIEGQTLFDLCENHG